MKQRIRVVGLIRNQDGVLIFKRSHGRSEAPVVWELPTGKIKFGEQPEEAMARSLTDFTGLTASSLKLRDVVTFLASGGSGQLSNLYIIYELTIADQQKPTPRDRYTAYKYIHDFASANLRLDETSQAVLEIEEARTNPIAKSTPVTSVNANISPRETANSATINVDGASRGNPGPSGIGYCIRDEAGKIIEQGGEFIGFATSRLAEYLAMRKGLERAEALGLKSVRFVSDSLMVVNQLNGIFQIKNRDIIPIYQDIQSKLPQFDAVAFVHVPRTDNTCADAAANQAIDKILRK